VIACLFPLVQTHTRSTQEAEKLNQNNEHSNSIQINKEVRRAGDEWLFEGPGTYIPSVEVEVLEQIVAFVIQPNQALRVRARKETRDRDNTKRVTGEEWLVRRVGAYLPGVYEEIVGPVQAYVLTEKRALQMRALRTFVDAFTKERKTGEEWLITMKGDFV
jgi:major vault protein